LHRELSIISYRKWGENGDLLRAKPTRPFLYISLFSGAGTPGEQAETFYPETKLKMWWDSYWHGSGRQK
jgi:hypothetical protein